MWATKKKKDEVQMVRKSSVINKVIAEWAFAAQVRLAKELQKLEQKCTSKEKKFLLVVFCLLSSMYFLWLLVSPFMSTTGNPQRIKITTGSIIPPVEPPAYFYSDSIK